jgi:ABC-type sugar transport system ATPase subunit
MDEPTSAISDREVEALFRIIRELRRDGVAVIYISHRMAEVFRVADRVTVLRDGRRVASQPVTELDEARLIRLMVGCEVAAAPRSRARATGEVALEVRALGRRGGFRPLSFTLRRGEILGVAGLMGAGRTELLAALFGLAPADTGEIRVAGRPVRIRHPRDAYRAGIALVTEDRQASGVVPPLSVGANLTLANLRDYCRAGWIQSRREGRVVAEQIRRFAIRVADPRQRIRQLSGGNQQKVVLARALLTRPRVLLLDEPTRGIDVGAKAEIHALIGRLAADGLAILLVSSELPELMRLSDRLLVLREGELTGERRPDQTTPEEILALAMPAP